QRKASITNSDVRVNNGVQRQHKCIVGFVYKRQGKRTRKNFKLLLRNELTASPRACGAAQRHQKNANFTCSQIWHLVWQNGEFAPESSHIRDRVVATDLER
ncbi:hypothetical protein L914_11106, partial [Phytophthora nicotianae]